jgi:hypothetical protein
MKTFGQFLIDKNLISKPLLLDCILEQVSSLPGLSQLVKDKNLMDSEKILSAIETQSKDDIGFKEACTKLGFWNQDLEEKIKKESISLRTPIANIILKRGIISITDLTKALDEFFSNEKN